MTHVNNRWGIAAALAALVLVSAGCSSTKNADGDRTITDTVNGQPVRVDMPAGKTKGLAVWFHGQSGDVSTRMNEPWLNKLRVEGWAVASSDFHKDAWGNADAVAATSALVDWASEKAGTPATLYVAGSMGGVNSLNTMVNTSDDPKCWYGTMPVVDLENVGSVPKSAEQISAAYGSTIPASHNPAQNIDQLPDAKYRVLSSLSDTWVPAISNSDVLVAGLSAAGKEVSTRRASGEHGDPSHFNASDLAAFAASCL
jgi:hypothetical protein